MSKSQSSAQSLFVSAFLNSIHREPRSPAYKTGVLAAIKYRMGEYPDITYNYQPGTAEADAFHAGVDEGHAIARKALSEVAQ